MTRALCAVVAVWALALTVSTANAKPRHQATDSTTIYCAADQTYRQTCGQPENRMATRRIASAGGSALPCRRTLDCGCSLARELGISDSALARRLWVARDWLREFPRLSAPVVGSVVVLTRKGGGHVGLYKGVDPNGNPIVESFKYYGSTGEAVFPKSRVLGYVRVARL